MPSSRSADRPVERAATAGTLIAAGGAVSYGVTVVIGRDLASAGLDPATALGVRFGVAGIALLLVLAARRAPLRPLPGEWLRVLALGAIGYTTESTFFYLSLQRGTAAATALLFYVYPVLVSALEVARGHERPTKATALALCLSVVGSATVVAAGGDVSITTAGIAFALASAATYAVYLLVGHELGRRSDAMTAACWVAVGASMSSLARGAVTGTLSNPSGHMGQLVLYGVATAAAFALTFAALSRIGASRTAVVMTLEAISAVVLAAVFLDESIGLLQALGGMAVLAAAAIIAISEPSDSLDPAIDPGRESTHSRVRRRGKQLPRNSQAVGPSG
jgi:drug/metabolite transporter (DMT)-like permease